MMISERNPVLRITANEEGFGSCMTMGIAFNLCHQRTNDTDETSRCHDMGAAFQADLPVSKFMPGTRVTKAVHETPIGLEVIASLTCLITLCQMGDAVISTFGSRLRLHPIAALDAAITQYKTIVSTITLTNRCQWRHLGYGCLTGTTTHYASNNYHPDGYYFFAVFISVPF